MLDFEFGQLQLTEHQLIFILLNNWVVYLASNMNPWSQFKHPSQDHYVYIILDACHMFKVARNALGHLKSFYDKNNGEIKWLFIENLCHFHEFEGFNIGNKFSAQHLQFEKHKMNVRLAAQILSSSVDDAIEFLDVSMKLPQFQKAKLLLTLHEVLIQHLIYWILRNPTGKGYKQPLREQSRDTWEAILRSTARSLLSLMTLKNGESQLLSTYSRKTFLVGFSITIKSIIEMSNEMFSLPANPFKYIFTYQLSQDHIELFVFLHKIKRWME